MGENRERKAALPFMVNSRTKDIIGVVIVPQFFTRVALGEIAEYQMFSKGVRSITVEKAGKIIKRWGPDELNKAKTDDIEGQTAFLNSFMEIVEDPEITKITIVNASQKPTK
jgi:hypothetical protein